MGLPISWFIESDNLLIVVVKLCNHGPSWALHPMGIESVLS